MGAWDFIRPQLVDAADGRPVRRVAPAAQREPRGRDRPRATRSTSRRSSSRRSGGQPAGVAHLRSRLTRRSQQGRAGGLSRRSTSSHGQPRLAPLTARTQHTWPANIVVPEVGESIVDARVAKWLKKEGDASRVGEPLVELETDKIDLEVSAPQAGVLAQIDAPGRRGREGRRSARRHRGGRRRSRRSRRGSRRQSCTGRAAEAEAAAAAPAASEKTPRATPTARKAAEERKVDLTQRARQRRCRPRHEARRRAGGARRHGRGSSARRLHRWPTHPPRSPPHRVAEKPRAVAGDRTEERVRMSKRRATIAKRLVEAQSTAAMLTPSTRST